MQDFYRTSNLGKAAYLVLQGWQAAITHDGKKFVFQFDTGCKQVCNDYESDGTVSAKAYNAKMLELKERMRLHSN